MRYWCIRHDKAWRQEISGGYIWAPKRNSERKRQYSESILRVAAGDSLLSIAEGRIGHVGQTLDCAIGEPGRDGDGWWLPVGWTRLPKPVAADAGPSIPIAELPGKRFDEIVQAGGLGDWPLAPPRAPDVNPPAHVSASRLDYDAALTASVRDQQVKARRGQGLFRFRVFQIETACRLTGVARPDLLIASHIKPWRLCETTHERLDGANGLLLTPHVDRLFDRGLIGFSDDGEVLRSPALPEDDLQRLGLADARRRSVGAFTERQRTYLAWHRCAVFECHET